MTGGFNGTAASCIPHAVSDSLTAFAQGKLAALEAKSLKRTLVPTQRLDGLWVERNGRRLLSFSCND